ncbi:MAG: phosphoglycerate dehydrogenase [Longimicrobiales bacterium]|nr:phosphoglycerate dehydrogenase [Longimicrobiales bacterium]
MDEQRVLLSEMRILLADRIPATGLAPLEEGFELVESTDLDDDGLREALAGVDAVLVRSSTTLDRTVLEGQTRLRVIGRAGVGVDNIDVQAATEQGIAVFNAPSGNTASAAELTLALMLAVMRKVAAADRSMRAGEWDRKRFRGSELQGKTLALVGAGRIGGEVARRARAFGMRVIAYDPYLQEERARKLEIESVSLQEAMERGDVVSLHVPLTDATRGLIGADELGRMKPSAVLVNAARGGVLDETALADALRSESIAGAALDVYESEPLPADHPLRSLDNAVLTPHIGAATEEAQHNVAYEVAESVRNALLTGDVSRAINGPAVGGDLIRRLGPLMELGGRLGQVARALCGRIETLDVRYAGTAAEEALRPLTAAALVGLLRDVLGSDNVNLVNAGHLAESRGIHTSRSYLQEDSGFPEYLELRVAGHGCEARVAGALRGDHPRIVRIDDYGVDVRPEGVLVILRNRDVPGVIGHVGTLLGEAGVNIGEYHQGRMEAGGEALAAIAVDGKLPSELLDALAGLPEILAVHQVALSPGT